MTDGQRTEGDRTPEEEVWSAIGAFEQILEQMPEDRASLDALWRAYERIGDRTRAGQYLVRLAHVHLKAGDRAAAEALRATLESYAADDTSAAEPDAFSHISFFVIIEACERCPPSSGSRSPFFF